MKCGGYSEYYVLKAESKGLDGTTDMVINSVNSIETDIISYASKRIKHRAMLSRFAEVIS